MLATGARLKWDPSAYVPLRELAPFEYRVAACALPAAGVALLAAAHVPLLHPRRRLLRAVSPPSVRAARLDPPTSDMRPSLRSTRR